MTETKQRRKLHYGVAAASAATVATTIFLIIKRKNK